MATGQEQSCCSLPKKKGNRRNERGGSGTALIFINRSLLINPRGVKYSPDTQADNRLFGTAVRTETKPVTSAAAASAPEPTKHLQTHPVSINPNWRTARLTAGQTGSRGSDKAQCFPFASVALKYRVKKQESRR